MRSCSNEELARYASLISVGPADAPSCRPNPGQQLELPDEVWRTPGSHSRKNGTLLKLRARSSNRASGQPHFVHLRVIQSTQQWCPHPCDAPTWELLARKPDKSSPYIFFEAAIWQQLGRVTLYQFDPEWENKARNSYTMLCGGRAWGCANYENQREAHALINIPWEKGLENDPTAFSQFLKDAFAKFFAKMHEIAGKDNTRMGFTYGGHGGSADGSLFAGSMKPAESLPLLEDLTKAGGKFAILNWGTNCKEGKWDMFETMTPYAEWIIASDLNVGGLDESVPPDQQRQLAQAQEKYADVAVLKEDMESGKPYKEAVSDIIEARHNLWFGVMKDAIVTQKLRQNIAAFDAPKFPAFADAFKKAYLSLPAEHKSELVTKAQNSECDVLVVADFLDSVGAGQSLAEEFRAFRPMYATTRPLFDWDPVTHGMGFNARGAMLIGGKAVPNCYFPF